MGDRHAELGGKLAAAVGDANVSRAPRDLLAAGVVPGFGDPPAWVVRPSSAAEIAQVVRLCAAETGGGGVRLLPFGTASRKQPGDRPARARVLLDMKRMHNVLHLDETSLVVHVQAGITGLALEELLLPRSLTLGDFPPAALKSTIGGMLAVRTPGKASPRHGLIEDAVLGLSAVLADGRTLHTRVAPRRATGPDLLRALTGSEGALAILTGAVLRIHRRPEARLFDAHRLPGFAEAVAAVLAALRAGAAPSAVRIYDAAEAASHLGPTTAEGDQAVVVAATAGPPELAAVERELLAAACRERGGTSLGPAPAELWWRRRFGHPVPGPAPLPPVLELFAAPSRIAGVHRATQHAAAAAGRAARVHASRFSPDGACLFVTLVDGDRPDATPDLRHAVEHAARAAGAHLLGERDDTLAPYFASLKQALDPGGLFS